MNQGSWQVVRKDKAILIKEVSEKTGLAISTLRYYERRGILQPTKNRSGYRDYSDHDVAWIEFVQRLLQIGMPLTQVEEYSQLRHQGDTTIPDRLKLLHRQKTLLAQQQAKITTEIEFLNRKISTYNTILDDQSKNS